MCVFLRWQLGLVYTPKAWHYPHHFWLTLVLRGRERDGMRVSQKTLRKGAPRQANCVVGEYPSRNSPANIYDTDLSFRELFKSKEARGESHRVASWNVPLRSKGWDSFGKTNEQRSSKGDLKQFPRGSWDALKFSAFRSDKRGWTMARGEGARNLSDLISRNNTRLPRGPGRTRMEDFRIKEKTLDRIGAHFRESFHLHV